MVDADAFRRTLSAYPTGVTVVTTCDRGGRPVGVTANSFNAVSLDPPLVLWSLRLASASFPAFRDSAWFAVNILACDQADLSRRFAARTADKFAGLEFVEGLGGVPLLPGCAAALECRQEAKHPGGDHAIFIGRVERCTSGEAAPLLYCRGAYGAAA